MNSTMWTKSYEHRRSFIGGSDARIIMGDDESALLRLWREKRGEAEQEDLSGNLIVQLGLVTEDLNRQRCRQNPARHALHLWREKHCHYLRLRDFRKRTPSPPPFSSMSSTPAASMALCSFKRASS